MMSTDILGLCDGLLGEVGRRQHRFAWLLNPGAGPGEWLPVDAYYPSRRLVVVLDAAEPQAQLCTELMPQHGLPCWRSLPVNWVLTERPPSPPCEACSNH